MKELILFLQKWQTLIGAFIGGILGLLAAWIVARDARRREERAAAMLLITDLDSIRVAWETLSEKIKKAVLREVRDRVIAETLSGDIAGLALSPLFESSMIRIMPLDNYLAIHLALFKKVFTRFDVTLTELKKYYEIYRVTGKAVTSREELDNQLETITKHFHFASEHALCAEHLLDKLILRKTAPFHRIARKIPLLKYLAMKGEKPCIDLLKKGGHLPEATFKPPGPS